MEVAHVHADVAEVIGQFLGGALGERGDEHALLRVGALATFLNQIVNLAFERFESDLWVNEAGGAHDEFHDVALRPADFARCGSGAGVNRLVLHGLEFQKVQRPIVQRAWQAEPVIHQHRFARAVAFEHAADLRHGRVRFVNDEQIIVREKIKQRARLRTGRASGNVPRIILNAGANAHFLHHFKVVFRPLLDALGFEQFAVLLKPRDAFAEFLADGENGALQFVAGCDELFSGKNGDRVE